MSYSADMAVQLEKELTAAERQLETIRAYAFALRADLYVGPYMTDILAIIEGRTR